MPIELLKSLRLHKDKLWSLDCSKGLMATASSDRKIKLVNLQNLDFKLVEELDDSTHKKSVRSVSFRPNSSILAAGSFDSTISIWGKDDSDPLDNPETDLLAIIEGHENEVKGVAWSHSGEFLASCSRDKSVWIWEADELGEEYECLSVLQEHSQDVKHVVWHPNMNLLASSSYDDTIRLWKEDADDWECAAVLNGHEGTVWCSDFEKSEASLRLVSCSDDATVRVWKYVEEGEDGEDIWTLDAILPNIHSRAVYSVNWSSHGYIASAGSDGILAVYKEVEQGNWEVVAQQNEAHSVFEVNMVKWTRVGDKDLILTGGDDGFANVWCFTP
ncbi:LANO_0H22980g1_1 [Lachancea nothofagi CBS 11611]|uniref:Probable cytosolic iron-sulfur protein assembly protein 1 n=1 Tax=Lachancea nothofagi CBS 11611 TaxID=1266666 RepID=A0A1G4KNY0_9SACH|nr:LANO_0H22980g1_1 [Lachancea nothofagi CBS 11611]